MADLTSASGYILAISYPLLAFSTGGRVTYQLFLKADVTNHFPIIMSSIAALCYLIATIGFAYRRKWSWWLSVITLGIESALTLLVGVWSFIEPEFIGRTVWRHFGEDYGYFPLFQPLIGLVWLLWPKTLSEYGFSKTDKLS